MSLTRWLQEQGIKSATGKEWATEQLSTVLYSGRITGLREYKDEAVFEAVWPAIITRDQHERIRARIESRRRTGKRSPRRYLLSGLCRCVKCGHPLYSAARPRGRRYECRSGPNFGGCGHLVIVAHPVEAIIADLVILRLDTPELADALAGRSNANHRATQAAQDAAQARTQREELAQAYANRQISMSEWLTARKPIEQRLRDAERLYAKATETDALSGLVGNGASLRQQWDGLNLTRQHAIVSAVLDHVVIEAATPSNQFDPARLRPVWRL